MIKKTYKTKPGDKVTMHLLVRKPGGPFKSQRLVANDGTVIVQGGEFIVPCSPRRRGLDYDFRASVATSCVTCEECKKSKEYKEMAALQGDQQIALDRLSPETLAALTGSR